MPPTDRINDAWLRPSRDVGPRDQSGQDWLDRVNQTWFPIHPLPERKYYSGNDKCQHCVECKRKIHNSTDERAKHLCYFDQHHYCKYLFCDVKCPDFGGVYDCGFRRFDPCNRWPDIPK